MTQKAADADAEVTRELRRAGINENIGNINAVNELLATGELMAYTRALKGKGIGSAEAARDKNSTEAAAFIDSKEKLSEVLSGREKLEALRRLLRVHLQIQRKFLLTMIHLKN